MRPAMLTTSVGNSQHDSIARNSGYAFKMTQRTTFGSDNYAGGHPAVLAAMLAANADDAVVAYGADELTKRVTADLRATFGAEGDAFLVFSGGGANLLGLAALLRRYDAVICTESAHINTFECGAAEQILGAKLLTVPSPDGKLSPELIAGCLEGRGDEHQAQPSVVAITQSTELGTCYSLAELRKISEFCQASALRVYLDGARLSNAAAFLDCSLAELAECADILSFGGTKNGAVGVEALIVMRQDLVPGIPYLRKQEAQLASKMRFLAAQFGALLDGELWRANAAHANAMARRLAESVRHVPGVSVVQPVQANFVFARLTSKHIGALRPNWFFETWDEGTSVVRWMTAFNTTPAVIDEFAAAIAATAADKLKIPG